MVNRSSDYLKKYKCMKHKTNNGFYDSKGKWHCWQCYYENEFYNPRGKVIDSIEIPEKHILIRIVEDHDNNEERVEIWNTKKERRIHYYSYRDLSSAYRRFHYEIENYSTEIENTLHETELLEEINEPRNLRNIILDTYTHKYLRDKLIIACRLKECILEHCTLIRCEVDDCFLINCEIDSSIVMREFSGSVISAGAFANIHREEDEVEISSEDVRVIWRRR